MRPLNERLLYFITTLVALLCLSAGLELIGRLQLKVDLTPNQRYSLSDQLRGALKRSTEPIYVEAFLPLSAPAPYGQAAQRVTALLKEVGSAAPHGRWRLKITDSALPLSASQTKELQDRATQMGLPVRALQARQGGRLIQLKAPVGVRLRWLNQTRVFIPPERLDDLEEELLKNLHLLGSHSPPLRVAFSTGNGEPDLANSPLAAALSATGTLSAVRLDGASLRGRVDVLIVLGPDRALGARARYLIDQLLCEGGSVVIGLDHRYQSQNDPSIWLQRPSGLETLLEAHGISIAWQEVISDSSHSGLASLSRDVQGKPITTHHPVYPWVKSTNHSISEPLGRVLSPMSSPVKLSGAARPLFTTYESALKHPHLTALNPPPLKQIDTASPAGGLSIGAALSAPFHSVYTQLRAPPAPLGSPLDLPQCVTAQGSGRLVLLPSGRRLLSADPSGVTLFKRAVTWARGLPLINKAPSDTSTAQVAPSYEVLDSLKWWGLLMTLLPLFMIIIIQQGHRLRQSRPAARSAAEYSGGRLRWTQRLTIMLCVLIALLLLQSMLDSKQPHQPRSTSAGVSALKVSAWHKTKALTIQRPELPDIIIKRSDALPKKTWEVEGRPITQKLTHMLDQQLKERALIEEREVYTEEGLKRLGLGDAAIRLTLLDSTDEDVRLRVGAEQLKSATWVAVTTALTSPPPWRVYLIKGRLRALFDRSTHDWQDRSVTEQEADSLSVITLESQSSSWSLRRAAPSKMWTLWQNDKLIKTHLDQDRLGVLAYTFSHLSVTQWLPGQELHSHKPLYSFTLTFAQGERVSFGVGQMNGQRALWTQQGRGYLPEHFTQLLSPRIESLIDRSLVPVEPGEIRALSLHTNERTLSLSRANGGWKSHPPNDPIKSTPVPESIMSTLLRALTSSGAGVSPLPSHPVEHHEMIALIKLRLSNQRICAHGEPERKLCNHALTLTRTSKGLITVQRTWDEVPLFINEAHLKRLLRPLN